MRDSLSPRRYSIFILLVIAFALALSGTARAADNPSQGNWWVTTPEIEVPSTQYDSILYSEIGPKLREIEKASNRVKVEVIGQSAGGRNLFLVTVSDPQALGRLGQLQAIRQTMLKDPGKAQELIDKFGEFKVPVFINGSIHGGEYPGTDAVIRLIEKLAFDDSPEVQAILRTQVLLFNVVHNPDGRVLGTRANSNGFDLNRDFITQSQPETRAAVNVIKAWNPMIFLDLHGFVNPMLIEPCTPPHNPNYEYDLYIKWAFDQAKAMEKSLFDNTGFAAQIPFRDDAEGWDDWPPIFTPMYAMYHGSYGHTLETPYRDSRGVDAHYWAVWGALGFVAENSVGMIRDQIEIFERGFLGSLQVPIPQEILDQTPHDQYNDLTTIDFPKAYVIPKDAPLQQNPNEAKRLIDFLLFNDVKVEQAAAAFTLGDLTYPKGSYVVWLEQPKRGLANTILWQGWDISYHPGLAMYDISGWSLPLTWGVTCAVAQDALAAKTSAINKADGVSGKAETATKTAAFAYLPTCNEAVKATNDLLGRGVKLLRSEAPFDVGVNSFGAGTFVMPADQANARAIANELVSKWGLDVSALTSVPNGLIEMKKQKIALSGDAGERFVMTELGFDWTPVTSAQVSSGVLLTEGFDVWVNSSVSSSTTTRAAAQAFAAVGGDYVGVGRTGVPLATAAGLLTGTTAQGSSNNNGVLKVAYTPTDPVAAQYPTDSYGFVYGPLWFTSTGPDVKTAASIAPGDFFVAGWWSGWKTTSAAGSPVAVHCTYGDASAEITGIGLHAMFRAHPSFTYRLVANGIYNGLD
jgi:hypothetical protein